MPLLNLRRCAVLLMLGFTTTLHAEPPFWQPLVDDQTLLVAAGPVDADAWSAVLEEAAGYGPMAVVAARGAVASLENQSVRDAAILLGVPDIQKLTGPVAAFEVGSDGDPARVAATLEQFARVIEATQGGSRVVDTLIVDRIVLLGTDATRKRYAANYGHRPTKVRAEFADAMRRARGDGPAGALVVAPGADTRRVIRELWPTPPAPLNGLTGPLIADGVKHATVRLALAGPLELRVDCAAVDQPSAERVHQVARELIAAGAGAMTDERPDLASLAFALSRSLEPTRDADTVSITLRRSDAAIDRLLGEVLPGVTSELSEKALAANRMNQMKQLSLAMHSYHDRCRHFPASAAIWSKEGKPLLSWRVAVLPYLEGQALYDRFHLDEPWNSPHNLSLLKEMPEVFADRPRSALAQKGLTRLQVPVGPETLFLPTDQVATVERNGVVLGEGLPFRSVTDGTSNTLMIVELSSERAVPWTKPADWEVDFDDPLPAVREPGRKRFVTGWADGHAQQVSRDLPSEEFRKVLTRAGAEILDRQAW